jgi:hypothetical protein
MAVVPTTQPSRQLRTGGAAISGAAAGAVGAAVAGAGRQIEAIGVEALNRQRDADNAAFRTERSNSLLRTWTEKLADAETAGTEVDLGALKEEFDADVVRLGEGAPSDEAGQAFKFDADNAFSLKFFPGFAKNQSRLNVRKRVSSTTGALDDINAEVLTGRTGVAEALVRAESAIVGLSETAGGVVDIDKLREQTRNDIGRNALTSIIEADPRQALDEMNSGKWDKLTSAEDLQQLRQAANNKLNQQFNTAGIKFSNDLDNYVAFLSSGTADTPELRERFSDATIETTFGDQAGAVIENVNDARDFGQSLNQIKSASPAELSAVVEENRPTDVDQFSREARQFQVLNRAISARNTAISKDPSAYGIENSPDVSDSFEIFQQALDGNEPELIKIATENYTNAARAYQENIGVHSNGVQFLPAQMENAIGQRLNDFSQGGENVAIQINALKEGFGNEWNAVLSQLQINKKIGTGVKVMAGMPFGPEQISLGEAVAIGQKGFKEVLNPDDFNAIKDSSLDELSEFQETLRGQPGSEAVFGQYRSAIETLAMKYLSEGIEDSSDDALGRAVDDVLNKNFAFTDTYRIPSEQNADQVEDGVDFMIDKIQAGDIDLLIPESATIQNIEDRKEVYLSVLRPNPITSPDGSGILFTDQNGNALLDPNGEPVIMPWDRLEFFAQEEPGFF